MTEGRLTPSGQVNDEEDRITREARPCPHFDGDEIRRGEDL